MGSFSPKNAGWGWGWETDMGKNPKGGLVYPVVYKVFLISEVVGNGISEQQ